MSIEDIKFREVDLFLRLLKTKSVRDLARQVNMQPGQVSKWISGLEKKVGFKLIERSATGVEATAKALELLGHFEDLHRIQGELTNFKTKEKKQQLMTIASSSFFTSHVVPLALQSMTKNNEELKIRVIDLPPTQFISVALRGAFDYCLHAQNLDWPKTWTSYQVGVLTWRVYARKNHPVLKKATKANLLKYPFVVPVYWTAEGTRYGDDQCPIPMSERIKGHETATALSAAEMVKMSDQLAFVPDVIAKSLVKSGELVAVETPWKLVKKPVYLSVKNAVVKQKQFEEMIGHFRELLTELI
jgi:DNA-binding transcriptional LysR family regulator